MIKSTIAELFAQEIKHIDVEVKGWVKSFFEAGCRAEDLSR